jgi:hypothetical protein
MPPPVIEVLAATDSGGIAAQLPPDLNETIDRSMHYQQKTIAVPWFFVPKVILWFLWCQSLHLLQWSSLTAIDFGDFISDWGSMAGRDSWGWGALWLSIAHGTINDIEDPLNPLGAPRVRLLLVLP